MARFTVLLALIGHVQGWTATAQSTYGAQISEIQSQMNCGASTHSDPISEFGWLWYTPQAADDTRGLGGGITWAMDANLCALIKPKFREDIMAGSLIDCKEIHAAIARSFDKWAANSRHLKFTDMTEECTLAGLNYGPPTSGQPHQGAPCTPSEQPSGCVFPHGGCPLAEIWVTSKTGDYPTETSQSAASDGTSVATALPHAQYVDDFRYSNGARPCFNESGTVDYNRRVVETYAGTFSFETQDVCWYLDSQFCAPFHALKRTLGSPANARLLIWGLTFGLTTLAILFYLALIVRIVLRTLQCSICDDDEDAAAAAHDDEDGDGQLSCQERFNAVIRVVSHWNPFILTVFIMLLVLPGLVTTRIFAPCFDCYDFEAAALHEIGHFLGLGHPDNIPDNWLGLTDASGRAGFAPGNNSYHRIIAAALLNGTRPNPSEFCMDPWAAVEAGVPEGADIDETKLNIRYPTRDAQMEAVTQHNPKTCLYDDDLEALAVLYPDCDAELAVFEAVCHEVNLNLGIVRLAVYILIPSIIALFVVISCSSIVHIFERREKARMEERHEAAKEQLQEEHRRELARQEQKNKLRVAVAKIGRGLSRKKIPTGSPPKPKKKGASAAQPAQSVAVQSQAYA